MSFASLSETINARIRSNYIQSKIVWPNERVDPKLEAFIRPQVLTSSAERESMGENRKSIVSGILFCDVFVLEGAGQVDALEIADDFLSIFSDQTVENIEFEPGSVTSNGLNKNGYFFVTARIPFLARL